jgi:hypothetical protein
LSASVKMTPFNSAKGIFIALIFSSGVMCGASLVFARHGKSSDHAGDGNDARRKHRLRGDIMSLIDTFLPHHQFSERHQTTVRCQPGKLLDIIQNFRPARDRLGGAAMSIRQFPARLMHWLAPSRRPPPKPFTPANFIPLGRDGDREIVGGLVGKFWEIWSGDFGLLAVAGPVEFLACNPPNTAKLVIGFAAEPAGEATLLTTETRVYCPDRYSLLMFTPYWLLIRPVSGLLRRRALSAIRKIAED